SLFGDLGDDFTRSVRMETVDHHAVEAGQDRDLPRRLLCEFADPLGLADATNHQPHQFAGIDVGLYHRWFGLDDEIDAGKMDREVERLAAVLQHHAKYSLGRVGAGEVIDA